jgi:hypothetical protein
VAQEWHPKNIIRPDQVRPKTHKKYFWLCPKGHEYETSVASRTHLGTGCPLCAWQTSKLELRVYYELKALLPGVLLHDRSLGFEVDVLLSEHHIGIEVDGWYWHKDKIEWDQKKSASMVAAGVTPIRLRGTPLPLIRDTDIRFPKTHDQRVVLHQLVRALERLLGADFHYDPTVWLNDGEYQKAVLLHGGSDAHVAERVVLDGP